MLILDAGALIALERSDREVLALLKGELLQRRAPVTHGGVIGQAWRSGAGRQARLAALLPALQVAPLDESLGRRAGALLGRSRGKDVIDAAVVLLAADGDTILTSDPKDLRPLALAADVHVELAEV
jgi:hypothetical protein